LFTGSRIKWSDEELAAFDFFEKFFSAGKPPDFASIEKAKNKFPCLRKRSHAQIKARVWHEIKKAC